MKLKKRRAESRYGEGCNGVAGAVFCGGLYCEIASNKEAVFYGIKAIIDYTSEFVCLCHRYGSVSIYGKDLSCRSYIEGAVCIGGDIDSVQYKNT